MSNPIDGNRIVQQAAHNIRGGVGVATRLEKFCHMRDVVAGGHQRQFLFQIGTHLVEADVGEQSVAKAFPALRVSDRPAFFDKIIHRLGRATVAQRPVRFAIKMPEITQVADARPDRILTGF